MSRAIEIAAPLQIMTYDVDFAGVVSNIVYVRWLEDLRMAMIISRHQIPLMALIQQGIGPAIISTSIQYRRPLRLGDPVVGHAWFSRMDRRKAVISYEFRSNDQLAAKAEQTGVFVRLDNFRLAPMPKSWLEIYERTKTETPSPDTEMVE